MTSKVFTAKLKENRAFIAVLFIALTLRLYKLNLTFPFDYDQEVPAYAAYDFFINHKLSLIGQELSFQGFFLGPLHNWIEFIPYGICHLMPTCVPYFYAAVSLIIIIALYLTIRKIFDKKTAIIASFIYSISSGAIATERNVSSNYFIFLSSLILLFCLYQYFQKKNLFLPIGAFFAGLATVNFNPVFIFSSIAFFATALLRKEKKPLIFIISALVFFVNYFPLVVFNWRHQNLLVESIKNFANQNTESVPTIIKAVFIIRHIMVSFYTDYIFHSSFFVFTFLTCATVLIGTWKISKYENKFFLYMPIVIVTTFFFFLFYKGHIPDYYFQQTLLSIIVLLAVAIRGNILLPVICITSLIANMIFFVHFFTVNNYQFKKKVVDYILTDTKQDTFNVYFNLPRGLNHGFLYLIKAQGRTFVDGGKNLYILESESADLTKYNSTFPNKKVSNVQIGAFAVVSVK